MADGSINIDTKVDESGLKKGLANLSKTAIAGIGSAVTAIGSLGAASVKAYAEYEQLIGGIDTLFNKTDLTLEEYAKKVGKSTEEAYSEWAKLTAGSKAVFDNAEKAFQTAGLSANEYMDTVTSFSASLIQSLGGDTEKAAQYADMAIRDMSDNANKMGTDMELIQNAYNGFAKGNFTIDLLSVA